MPPLPAPTLFSPLRLGSFQLAHRVVMATPPRRRARAEGLPTALMALHHAQRASAGGLMVSEPLAVRPAWLAAPNAPGLYNSQQANLWRQVTDAVHQRGGIMVAQLAHGLPQARGGLQALDGLAESLRDAAELAGDAGFDGIELLASQGADPPAGPAAADAAAMLTDLLQGLIGVWSGDRVGLALAPAPGPAWPGLLPALPPLGLAYLRLLGPDLPDAGTPDTLRRPGTIPLLAGGDAAPAAAAAAVAQQAVDAVVFELAFVANPDLPQRLQRLRLGAALAAHDPATLGQGGAHGYTDYATLDLPS